ncbi:hypothetical protein BJY04DRAFT_179996 [Aspergillus karnatakaensis]|uniref:uncharacterized protein n=1 Tax=Aspergillus karnatakaensis TaxID=1810916 RepID=UPI003CCD8D63
MSFRDFSVTHAIDRGCLGLAFSTSSKLVYFDFLSGLSFWTGLWSMVVSAKFVWLRLVRGS